MKKMKNLLGGVCGEMSFGGVVKYSIINNIQAPKLVMGSFGVLGLSDILCHCAPKLPPSPKTPPKLFWGLQTLRLIGLILIFSRPPKLNAYLEASC